MPFTIIRQDITKMQVDAIVNAANTDLTMGGGVCGAIFKAAGAPALQAACALAAPIETGDAAITPGFALPCKYIIHAAGPVYNRLNPLGSKRLLYSAYISALRLAEEKHCESIAFPMISAGTYRYPKGQALRVATAAIRDFLNEHDMDVYLTVFGAECFDVGKKLLGNVASYIDDNYVEKHSFSRGGQIQADNEYPYFAPTVKDELYEDNRRTAPSAVFESAPQARVKSKRGIDEALQALDEPFGNALMRLIDFNGKTDVQVYKRANLDRKLFSKIRTVKGYIPSKRTILALSIAMELDISDTEALLRRAGYALSHSQKFDVIVEYFILHREYDIYVINEVLFQYDQPLLGG